LGGVRASGPPNDQTNAIEKAALTPRNPITPAENDPCWWRPSRTHKLALFNQLAIYIEQSTPSREFHVNSCNAGYIGSHMVYQLTDADERVVVLDNLSTGFDWAVAKGVPLIVGDTGDQNLVAQIIREHEVDSIIHFAAWLVVPDSVKDPLGNYKNNTVNSQALIETAIKDGLRQFIFSSTCAVYGNPAQALVDEDTPAAPISPYGWSKLMTEIMLRDAGMAHDLRYVVLHYFNVAGAEPKCRAGQSTKNATQLIKVAVEAALGHRSKVDIYGSDYSTPRKIIATVGSLRDTNGLSLLGIK
jgi:UDP-glucose-4-epimerase GalE